MFYQMLCVQPVLKMFEWISPKYNRNMQYGLVYAMFEDSWLLYLEIEDRLIVQKIPLCLMCMFAESQEGMTVDSDVLASNRPAPSEWADPFQFVTEMKLKTMPYKFGIMATLFCAP